MYNVNNVCIFAFLLNWFILLYQLCHKLAYSKISTFLSRLLLFFQGSLFSPSAKVGSGTVHRTQRQAQATEGFVLTCPHPWPSKMIEMDH